MLIFNYAEWTFWETYNPPTFVGGQKVTFDGPNKLILVNFGEIALDVTDDIYSNWKEWMLQRDNSKFLQALSPTGGDPIDAVRSLGRTFFLENGWRVRSWSGNHTLNVTGNLFTREPGQSPYVAALGGFNVGIINERSNLTELITPQVALSAADITAVSANTATLIEGDFTQIKQDVAHTANNVWTADMTDAWPANSAGELVRDKLAKKSQLLYLEP